MGFLQTSPGHPRWPGLANWPRLDEKPKDGVGRNPTVFPYYTTGVNHHLPVFYSQCHLDIQRLDKSPHGAKVIVHCFQVLAPLCRKLPDRLNLFSSQQVRIKVS